MPPAVAVRSAQKTGHETVHQTAEDADARSATGRRQDAGPARWTDPDVTADGAPRAKVALRTSDGVGASTLWFNTGTLCNIACASCYIGSSPTNDRLVYLTAAEVAGFLDQIPARGWPTKEIGFTGGEPFLNADFPDMLADALERGHRALVLTNAMRPMMRPRVMARLLALKERFGAQLVMRVSIDHYTQKRHDEERGRGAFKIAADGIDWLLSNGFNTHLAGRLRWDPDEATARAGFARLFRRKGWALDAEDPSQVVLFPEMDPLSEPPEITTACWGILGKSPEQVMCASSRMVVKRKGASGPTVLACTLIPYDAAFELGSDLASAEQDVALNHRYCATFCVLGGASCSA